MRGYPQFSLYFYISIVLAKIYFSCIVIHKLRKNTSVLVGTTLN